MAYCPIWLMTLSPSTWLFLIPALLIITALTLFIFCKIWGLDNDWKKIYLKGFPRVFLCSFVMYFLGTMIMFLSQNVINDWWYEFIYVPLVLNPLDNIYAMLYTVGTILLCGAFVFVLNTKFALRTAIDDKRRRRNMALLLAIFTLPLIYLFPSQILYQTADTTTYYFTNHTVWLTNDTLKITDSSGNETIITDTPSELSIGDEIIAGISPDAYTVYANAVNHAGYAETSITRNPDYIWEFYSSTGEGNPVSIEVWYTTSSQFVLRCDGEWRLATEYEGNEVVKVLP